MFKAVLNLFGWWELAHEQAATLLDMPVRSYLRWKAEGPGRVSRDGAARLSNLMGIHKALRIVFFPTPRAVMSGSRQEIAPSPDRAHLMSCSAANSPTSCACAVTSTPSSLAGDRLAGDCIRDYLFWTGSDRALAISVLPK